MENCADMDGISNNTNIQHSKTVKIAPPDSGAVIEAHYTDNIKVKRPQITPDSIKIAIPDNKKLTNQKMNQKLRDLNTDIFEAQQKEVSNREFNPKTFFKIIASFVLAAASVAGIRKLIGLFRK